MPDSKMRKSLYSVILLFFLFFSSLGAADLLAAQIPILNDTAKQRPQGSVRKIPAVSSGSLTTLGQSGDISTIKSRPGRSGISSTARVSSLKKKISSKSYIIIDAETGETLVSRSPDNPRQPASTIKVLTGMIALKSLGTNDWVTVSRKASGMPRSKVYLDTKKSYRANDLINAVLLASANDASVALAEKIAGSESDFARMMTLRAKLWGAKKTVCRTATGLTAKGQQSTARDLATIFRHAMQDKEFSARMSRAKIRTSYGKMLRNHNKALWRVKGAEGGKTGYTRAARQTYVGQFTQGDGTIVVAIMGSESMWSDIEHLVGYGFTKQKQLKLARKKLEQQGKKVAMAK